MEVEKRSLKGGFLQLFDWNVKSRKKLFSNKSEAPESSKHGKENFNGPSLSQFQKAHDYGFGLDAKQNYDYHPALSVSSDENYGLRPPGVVARLMGLDSLPISQVSELYQAPPPYRDSHYPRATSDFKNEHRTVVYENVRNKLDGFSMNPVEMRLQKVQNLPIERFQTEVLPPKSAKPISITQHRMLSPIKSPGFIPPKNAEYIMEAAARIIQQSPKLTIKNKMQYCSSSSVPLRIRDLREKMDAAQKSSKVLEVSQRVRDHNPVKNLRRQPTEKVQGQPEETRSFWAAEVSKRDVSHSRGKEKSVSLAVQAKTNIQKREGSAPPGNRTSVTSKEYTEGKSGRNRPNTQRSVEKRASSKTSNVLRQNNQKQNSSSNKDAESTKSSVSYPKERRSSSTNDITRPSKTVKNIVVNNRNSSGAARFMATDIGKEPSTSRSKTLSGKEQLVKGDIHSDGTAANNILKSKDDRSVKCNVTIEGCTDWDGVERKNGMDVISFTFTSPIKKTVPGSTPSSRVMEKKNILSLFSDSCDNQSFPKSSITQPLCLNVIGGDALGVLLDEKLKELTSIVGSSVQYLNEDGSISSSANTLQDSAPSFDSQRIISTEHNRSQSNLIKEKTDIQCDFVSSPVDVLQPKTTKWQQSEDIEEDSNGIYNGNEREFSFQYPSPASSVEPSFSAESCTLSDSYESFSGYGTKNHFAGSHEVRGWNSSIALTTVEDDMELLDSASSVSMGSSRNRKESTVADVKGSTYSYWELEYIRDIIRNADLMMKESVPSEAHTIISADLFEQLEMQKIGSNKYEQDLKGKRRLVFDCVVEQLEFRYEQSICGSFHSWARWTTLVQRKEWLANELYREISGWTGMEDLMVDELVDKDMSTQHGKWTDFEMEELEEGMEIDKEILTSLLEELMYDIVLS